MKRLLTIAAVVLWAGVACAQSGDFKYNGRSFTSSGVSFADLSNSTKVPAGNTLVYCNDCTQTTTCAAGGSGAWAKNVAGVWKCTDTSVTGSATDPLLLNTLTGTGVTPTIAGYNGAHDNEINLMAYGASGAGVNVTTATGTAGQNTITVANASGWKAGQGIIVHHAGAAVTLSTPSAPTVTPKGTTGASTCTYAIRALTAKRGYTAASVTGSSASCNATQTSSNFNYITWPAVANAWGYAVERTAPNPGLIAVTTDTNTTDFGQASPWLFPYGSFPELPSTANGSTGANWLQTTVSNVNGTTLTLGSNLTTSITSQEVSHDDTTPLTNAYAAAQATNKKLYVPQGTYFFCGTPLNGGNLNLLGVASQSVINICDGQYLFQFSGPTNEPSQVDGMTFVGGLGAFDSTTATPSTQSYRSMEWKHDHFYNFTGAAIAVEQSDWPFWKVDHCFFLGLDYNNTIGVALPGSTGIQVLNSDFEQARIGIKFSSGGTGNIVANDTFIASGTYANAQKPRVGVWLVPPGGGGFVAENNKYGNENLIAADARNLVMPEASGSSFSTKMPAMVTADDLTMTVPGATISSAAECPFTSAMCQGGTGCTGTSGNWGIVVQGAGRTVGAASDALTSTITTFNNSCSVVLANVATNSISPTIARMTPPTGSGLSQAHFIKNLANGNGTTGSAPFIVSSGFSGNDISYNTFTGGLPSEVLEQLIPLSANPTDPNPLDEGNVAAGNIMVPLAKDPPGQLVLCNLPGFFPAKVDSDQLFSGTSAGGEMPIQYALTGDVGDNGPLVTPLLVASWTAEFGATLIGSVADSFGKTNGDAAEFSVSNGGDIWPGQNFTGTPLAGVPMWVYFETKAGSVSPISRLRVEIRAGGSGEVVFSRAVTISTGWHPWLFKYIPSVAPGSPFIRFDTTWFDGNDTGRFQIGRVRVYQAWTPPPMVDQNINGQLNATGGIINGCKGDVTLAAGSGTFTNACVTTASACQSKDITTPANTCTVAAPGAGSVAITGTGTDHCRTWCE